MAVSDIVRKRTIASSNPTTGNGMGLLYSDDFGRIWEQSNISEGKFDSCVYASSGRAVTRALDGSSLEGLYYSDDGGATWTRCTIPTGYYTKIKKLQNGLMFTSAVGGKTYSSEDGMTWEVAGVLTQEFLFSRFDREKDFETYLAAHHDSGRDLMTVFGCSTTAELGQKLQEKSNNADFSGLMPCGDYIDFPSITFNGQTIEADPVKQGTRFVVASLDHYYNIGDTPSPHGIVFIAKRSLCGHTLNWSQGNTAMVNAVAQFETMLGVTLKTVHRGVNAGWQTSQKLFYAQQGEVFADPSYVPRSSYHTAIPFPIFSKCPQARLKLNALNGTERITCYSYYNWRTSCLMNELRSFGCLY